MDLDSSWLHTGSQMTVDDELFPNTILSTWEGYSISTSAQVNAYVTVHPSTTAYDAVDYNMEMDSFTERKSLYMEGSGSWLDEQFSLEPLPGSPEMGHMTDLQLRQYVAQLNLVPDVAHFMGNASPTIPPVVTPGQQAVDWKHFQPISPEILDLENEYGVQAISDPTVATVPECEAYADDVIDLLNQLTDKMDSDMYIDPADLEAFVSFPLHPVSPDDIESLLSSQLSAVDTRVNATASSSFHSSTTETSVPETYSPLWTSTENVEVASPCLVEHVVEKKRKKQDQNKTAALRYRQKKRDEHGTVLSECEELEKRNIELKTKVAEMTKEIDYLKGLIEEISAA